MNYSKPEIRLLGEATLTIQGSNSKRIESVSPFQPLTQAQDCELDD